MDKFKINNKTVLVKNYHKSESAKFLLFENCFIGEKIKNGEIWEKYLHEVFEKYLNDSSIVIDAGAFVGTHTVKLSKICKTVYAFEPLWHSYKLLEMNVKLNNCKNVILKPFGLSDKSEKTYFEWNRYNNLGASALKGNNMNFFLREKEDIATPNMVNLISIDSLALTKLDFIKIDVEGYEIKVINGALNTIKKCKPYITSECYSDSGDTPSDKEISDKFKNLLNIGYYYIRLEHHTDLLFIPL